MKVAEALKARTPSIWLARAGMVFAVGHRRALAKVYSFSGSQQEREANALLMANAAHMASNLLELSGCFDGDGRVLPERADRLAALVVGLRAIEEIA